MSDIPGDLKFLSSHEWARVNDDGTVTIGISDHAQSQLGDIVYVELPEIGRKLNLKETLQLLSLLRRHRMFILQ